MFAIRSTIVRLTGKMKGHGVFSEQREKVQRGKDFSVSITSIVPDDIVFQPRADYCFPISVVGRGDWSLVTKLRK